MLEGFLQSIFILKDTNLIQPDQTVPMLMNVRIHKLAEGENASTTKVDMNANVRIVSSYCLRVNKLGFLSNQFVANSVQMHLLAVHFHLKLGAGCVDLRTGNCFTEFNTSRNGLPVCGGDITVGGHNTNTRSRGIHF